MSGSNFTGPLYIDTAAGDSVPFVDEFGHIIGVGSIGGMYRTVGFSGSDYIVDGTDDDVEIIQALDDIQAGGGGILFMKEGTFIMSNTINWTYTNVCIRGAGMGRTILLANENNTVTFATDCVIELEDLTLKTTGTATGKCNGIAQATDLELYGHTVDYHLLRVEFITTHAAIAQQNVQPSAAECVTLGDIIIVGCHFSKNCTDGPGARYLGPNIYDVVHFIGRKESTKRLEITDNIWTKDPGQRLNSKSINLTGDSMNGTGMDPATALVGGKICRNFINGSTRDGFYVEDTTQFLISENRIRDLEYDHHGVGISNHRSYRNIITDNYIENTTWKGLRLEGCIECIYSNNQYIHVGLGGSQNNPSAISCLDSYNCVIVGNILLGDRNQAVCIDENSTGNYFANNKFLGEFTEWDIHPSNHSNYIYQPELGLMYGQNDRGKEYISSATIMGGINNGGFEKDIVSTTTNATVSYSSTIFYLPNRSLKVDFTANASSYVNITGMIHLKAGFKYKIKIATKGTLAQRNIVLSDGAGNTMLAYVTTGTPNNVEWGINEAVFTAVADTNILRIACVDSVADTVYFDNISIRQAVEDTTSDNINIERISPSMGFASEDYVENSADTTFVAVNTYLVPTAVSELAADIKTVTPTKTRQLGFKIDIINKGTGDFTFILHNAANTILCQAPIANASISNGQQIIYLPSQWTSGDIHLHIKSTVNDATVRTGTANDLSTLSFIQYASLSPEQAEVVVNGVKTVIGTPGVKQLHNSVVNIENGTYNFHGVYRGDLSNFDYRFFSDFVSYTQNQTSTDVIAITGLGLNAGAGKMDDVVLRVAPGFPIKSGKLQIRHNTASVGARSWKLQYSTDAVNYTDLVTYTATDSVTSQIDIPQRAGNEFYLRFKAITSICYILRVDISLNIDTSSVLLGNMYPLKEHYFTKTLNRNINVSRIIYRNRGILNGYGVHMPGLEFVDSSGTNVILRMPLEFDNSLETDPCVTIGMDETTNGLKSGSGSSYTLDTAPSIHSDGNYTLNDGEYMNFSGDTPFFKIQYRVGSGTTSFVGFSKNVIYVGNIGDSTLNPDGPGGIIKLVYGVSHQGLIDTIADVREDVRSIQYGNNLKLEILSFLSRKIEDGTNTSGVIRAMINNVMKDMLIVDAYGNVAQVKTSSALAQAANDGFLYIPAIADVPSGSPRTYQGMKAISFDLTTEKLWLYTGTTWKYATLT